METLESRPEVRPARLVPVILLIWLASIAALAAADAFATTAGPPLALLAANAIPVAAFLIALQLSVTVRQIVHALDLPLITAMQAFRFAGFTFVALWAQGLLPGYFAWPAGVGDMAIAFAAPWIAVSLARRPRFAADNLFVRWNVLGIIDLVVAVGLGAVAPVVLNPPAGPADTSIMTHLPLVLVPAYLVPVWTMLHLAALVRSRSARTGTR